MIETIEPAQFLFWLRAAAKRRPLIAQNCSDMTVAQLRACQCYVHRDTTPLHFTPYTAGFALSQDGTLYNLFSREPGCGNGLMEEAVARGARRLECYDVPPLVSLYNRHGFRETNRIKNWQGPAYPDVVFMVRKG